MIRTVLLVVICLATTSSVVAELPADPTLDELKQIVSKPHSPKLASSELRIYPSVRKYHIRATMYVPQRDPAPIEMDGDEKWVDGKFIVSSFQFPGADQISHMIVTYDGHSHCYRKWVISSQSIGETMIGTRVGDSRTVSWVSLPSTDDENKRIVISQETHTDKSTEWSELHLNDDQIVARVKGKAVASK